ncbi:hypothetical protein [Mycobacterium kubicae]|nr:hypothetical protein [Mycobacterium kubicae]
MGYRIVQTAVGWLLYADGEQLGVYDTAVSVAMKKYPLVAKSRYPFLAR